MTKKRKSQAAAGDAAKEDKEVCGKFHPIIVWHNKSKTAKRRRQSQPRPNPCPLHHLHCASLEDYSRAIANRDFETIENLLDHTSHSSKKWYTKIVSEILSEKHRLPKVVQTEMLVKWFVWLS